LEEDIGDTEKKNCQTLPSSKPYSDNEIKLDFVVEVAGNSIRSPLLRKVEECKGISLSRP